MTVPGEEKSRPVGATQLHRAQPWEKWYEKRYG